MSEREFVLLPQKLYILFIFYLLICSISNNISRHLLQTLCDRAKKSNMQQGSREEEKPWERACDAFST